MTANAALTNPNGALPTLQPIQIARAVAVVWLFVLLTTSKQKHSKPVSQHKLLRNENAVRMQSIDRSMHAGLRAKVG